MIREFKNGENGVITLKIWPNLELQQFEIKPATKMINFKDVKKGDYLEPTFPTPAVTWGTDWLRRGICGSGNQRA